MCSRLTVAPSSVSEKQDSDAAVSSEAAAEYGKYWIGLLGMELKGKKKKTSIFPYLKSRSLFVFCCSSL